MKVGIKVGPENYQNRFEETNARYCEVWYRTDWHNRYIPLFKYLHSHDIKFGLHFWGIIEGPWEANLFYRDNKIAEKSVRLIAHTIEIARIQKAHYVVVHPGSYSLRKLNLDKMELSVLDNLIVDEKSGFDNLITCVSELQRLAKKSGVLFILETLPRTVPIHWRDESGRKNVCEAFNPKPDVYKILSQNGYFIANDLGHTMSWWDENTHTMFDHIMSFSREISWSTKLIHLNTTTPPFNGSDSHNGILSSDFDQGAFPSLDQIRIFLSLFKDRDDLWIIPEPQMNKMTENYQAISDMVTQI